MLSNIVWFAIEPSHLLVWTLIAAAVQSARHKISGAVLAALSAVFLTAMLLFPFGNSALRPIEDQVPRPAWPDKVDGILVLGEGLNLAIPATRGVGGIGSDGGTLIATRILAQRYPNAKFVYAGDEGEVAIAKAVFAAMGMTGPILFDDRSRNSWDNLVYAREIAKPGPDETWLLVAAGYHLPRAAAVARELDWPMIPWASDYLSTASGRQAGASLPSNLAHLDLAAHEVLGLMAYKLRGEAR
jgi:uncharacterized SAM-binding protein YcdF (DUF218 family)